MNRLEQVTQANTALTTANGTLTDQLEERTQANTALTTRNGTLMNRLEEVTQANTALTTRNDTLMNRLKEFTQANTALTTTNGTLTKQLNQFAQANTALTTRNDTLMNRLEEVTQANTAFTTRDGTLMNRLKELIQANTALTTRNDTLMNQLKEFTQANTALTTTNDTLTNQLFESELDNNHTQRRNSDDDKAIISNTTSLFSAAAMGSNGAASKLRKATRKITMTKNVTFAEKTTVIEAAQEGNLQPHTRHDHDDDDDYDYDYNEHDFSNNSVINSSDRVIIVSSKSTGSEMYGKNKRKTYDSIKDIIYDIEIDNLKWTSINSRMLDLVNYETQANQNIFPVITIDETHFNKEKDFVVEGRNDHVDDSAGYSQFDTILTNFVATYCTVHPFRDGPICSNQIKYIKWRLLLVIVHKFLLTGGRFLQCVLEEEGNNERAAFFLMSYIDVCKMINSCMRKRGVRFVKGM
jgi:regulator of replication initiation timing